MLFDSHAHLNFKDFDHDRQEIIADCLNSNIWAVNVGSQLETSKKAIEIAESYKQGMYVAVGLHPIHVVGSNFHPEEFKVNEYKKLIQSSKKVVAVGETGLDFFHNDKNFFQQKEIFLQHINLAREFGLPLILHSRNSKDGKMDAYARILETFRQDQGDNLGQLRGVIHCYGGTLEQAKEFLELGFFFGFTGVITFPKTEKLAEIIKFLPLEKILIETDCPFLAPQPQRGKRNQPQYVKFVAEKIAEIKGIEYSAVAEQTSKNAQQLFGL